MSISPPLVPVRLQGSLCKRCRTRWYPSRSRCSLCRATDLDDILLPEGGTIYSFTVVRVGRPGVPVPYGVCVADFGGVPVFGRLLKWEAARIGGSILAARAVKDAADAGEGGAVDDYWLVPAAGFEGEGNRP